MELIPPITIETRTGSRRRLFYIKLSKLTDVPVNVDRYRSESAQTRWLAVVNDSMHDSSNCDDG